MHDLVTFGEAMLRLAPPHFARLEQATQFDLQAGGSEFNVAAGAARLGLATSWVSLLPDNPLGRMVRNKAREQGIETRGVTFTRTGRLGLYFVEFGAAPRPSSVLYDRAHSAMAGMTGGEIDWAQQLAGARAFHVSGITPALGAGAAAATRKALEAARAAGCFISYDLNFRRKLWTAEEARRVQEPLLPLVDLLISNEEDAQVLFGIAAAGGDAHYAHGVSESSHAQVARALHARFGSPAVAITLRESPAVWRNIWSGLVLEHDTLHSAPRYELEVVDRIGAGDAFVAGLLARRLQGAPWDQALAFATAFSALKHSIPGDANWATAAETEALLKDGGLRVAR